MTDMAKGPSLRGIRCAQDCVPDLIVIVAVVLWLQGIGVEGLCSRFVV